MFQPLRGFLHGDSADNVHHKGSKPSKDGRNRGPWPTFVFLAIMGVVILGGVCQLVVNLVLHPFTPAEGDELPAHTYAVNTSPTRYLLCSSVPVVCAFILVAPLVTLSTFSHARYMYERSRGKGGNYKELSIENGETLINILSGRLTSLGCGLEHCFQRNRALVHSQIVAATVLLALLLFTAVAMLAGDIALHGSTKSIEALGAVPGKHIANSWGRALSLDCDVRTASSWSSLDFSGCKDRLLITNQTAQQETVDSTGSPASVDQAILSGNTALLVDGTVSANSSFIATTYGVTTTCQNIGLHCQVQMFVDGTSPGLNFICPTRHFSGSLLPSDSNASGPVDTFVLSPADGTNVNSSPVEFYVAMKLLGGRYFAFENFANDASVTVWGDGDILFSFLSCRAEVQAWRYRYSDGYPLKVKNDAVKDGVTPLVLSPMFLDVLPGFHGFGADIFSADVGDTTPNFHSVDEIAAAFGRSFSKAATVAMGNITRPIPNTADLAIFVVATIPKALFWYYVGCGLFFLAIMTTVLILAIRDSRNPLVRELQYALTLKGVSDLAFQSLANERAYQEEKLSAGGVSALERLDSASGSAITQ